MTKHLVAICLAGSTFVLSGTTAQNAPAQPASPQDAAAFKTFLANVQNYVKLHKSVEGTLPRLKSKEDSPEIIVAHRQALARKLADARKQAKVGDIFSPDTVDAFRRAIAAVFHGPDAGKARATVQGGAPVKPQHLAANQPYPETVPYTTVPPTLLQTLPQLPDEVAYRIVGHDLILLDVKAAMVVDVLPDVIP